uniref:Uncharacterized protein TCIL3000_10_11200 n=1 Tax=Trypanosoma congolense (strain IL3000) TaxID=1068625 RepID=G0UY74_TRYCI|nr:unnamed protein product [Trypanosoma congolense IL3000]
MMEDDLRKKIDAAQRDLALMKKKAKAMEMEQRDKEALLRELEASVEDLDNKKRVVLDRVKEVDTESKTFRDQLRFVEHLDMLEGMLFEKKTRLNNKQSRRNTLMQQLSDIGMAVDGSQDQLKGFAQTVDVSAECHWSDSVGSLKSNINGIYRLFQNHVSHALENSVTVFHQSIRKISQMASDQEAELGIQLEDIDAQTEHAKQQEDALYQAANEYEREVENMQQSVFNTLQAISGAAQVELTELRKEIQQAICERDDLQRRLQMCKKVRRKGIQPCFDQMVEARGNLPMAMETGAGCAADDIGAARYSWGSAGLEPGGLSSQEAFAKQATGPHESNLALHQASSSPTWEGATALAADSETEALRRRVTTMDRYVQRIYKRHEELEDEVSAVLKEHNVNVKRQEAKLKEASDAVVVLEKERREWKSLEKQMSLLAK